MTPFEEIGGERTLREVIETFVDRITSDMMIGFFFRHVDIARLKDLEYQHAAQLFGAPVVYEGRPLQQAHRSHRIMDGQFNRRIHILREVCAMHHIPQHITDHWLEHQNQLRDHIVQRSC